jgi:hypothetical protein
MINDECLGTKNEFSVLDLLLSKNIELTKREYKYDIIDFYYDTDDMFFEIELKSRRNTLNAFPTTLLAKNKIRYYIRNKNNKVYNKKSAFFIIFGFPIDDGNNKDNENKVYEFYYIQYLKNTFAGFETWYNVNEFNKPYYLVPIELLKPIENLVEILDNRKPTT